MKRIITLFLFLILLSFSSAWSQADPEIDGPSLICKPIHNTVYAVYSYDEHTSYPNATITYSVKDRDGDSFNSGDLSTSISGGVLTVTINKNDFDFIVKMTVKDGTTTIGVYNLKTQVGLGDEPTNDMISFNKTPRCGSDSYVTVTIDKERMYGVEFHWTPPSGLTQIEGGYNPVIVVQPNGLNGGTFTCTEKFYGDEFLLTFFVWNTRYWLQW